ncbi:MAG: ABC transporter permease [Anaerolineae bacterium]
MSLKTVEERKVKEKVAGRPLVERVPALDLKVQAKRVQVPDIARKLIVNPLSLTGLIIVFFFIFVALAAPLLAPPWKPDEPYRIWKESFATEPQPPNPEHPFGTTESQYDIYYGVVWGTRTAFRVGLVITLTTVLIGLTIGSVAAYYGGWIDEVLMRIVEVFMTFPFLLAAITLVSVLQTIYGRAEGGVVKLVLVWATKLVALISFGHMPWKELDPTDVRLITGMLALIAFGWMSYARLIRGDILSVKERDFVMAARTLGAGDLRILLRHILPNAIYPTMVVASMDIGSYVLSFAALSFLGLGAPIGYADWGQMISLARNWISRLAEYWYILIYPGMAILLFVLGWNLIGDAFRDILDPKLRRPTR